MTSEQCDLLLDYFNRQLTKEEKEAFENHLTVCNDCRGELDELQRLTEDLPFSSEPIEPPNNMKERVLSNVKKESINKNDEKIISISEKWNEPTRKRNSWYKPLVAAILGVSLIGNSVALVYITSEDEVASPETDTNQVEASLDIVQRMESLKPSEGFNGKATAMMVQQNEKINLIVQASALPQLQGDETYQVWVLDDGKPFRAGTFIPNNDGVGAVSYVMDHEGQHNWDTIAITKEPNANSQIPKGEILLSSPL